MSVGREAEVLQSWGLVEVLGPMRGGARSELFRITLDGQPFVARRTKAGEASLRWLDRAQSLAQRCGLSLPRLRPTQSGRLTQGGWTVEPFIDGNPARQTDLAALRPYLMRFHKMSQGFPARPGHPPIKSAIGLPSPLCVRAAKALPTGETCAIHGDLHVGNLIRQADGRLVLIDWEEARRDLVVLDQIALLGHRNHRERWLMLTAEAVACWRIEPMRGRRMAGALRNLGLLAS